MKANIIGYASGLLIFAGGAILNYFGSDPKILYLPLVAFIVWLDVIIFTQFQGFISKQIEIKAAAKTPLQNTETKPAPVKPAPVSVVVPVNIVPTKLTPADILAEVARAMPFQKDHVAKTFIGAPVNWKMFLNSINRTISLEATGAIEVLNIGLEQPKGGFVFAKLPIAGSEHLSLLKKRRPLASKGNY